MGIIPNVVNSVADELIGIDTSNREGLNIVRVRGRLGINTECKLRDRVAELIKEHNYDLILDFTDVTFMDSSGMSSVLSAMRQVNENKGSICIVCETRHILRVLRITAIDKLMAIYSTVDEAIVAFKEAKANKANETSAP